MLAWFSSLNVEVQVAFVALISAVSVTLIPIFRERNSSKTPERHAEIAGAIVDSSSIEGLRVSIVQLTETIEDASKANERTNNKIGDEIARLREEFIRSGIDR